MVDGQLMVAMAWDMEPLVEAMKRFKAAIVKAWQSVCRWWATLLQAMTAWYRRRSWRWNQTLWLMEHPGYRRYRSRRRKWMEATA